MESIVYINAYNAPEIDRKEVFRYASVKEETPELATLLDECIGESEGKLNFKVCYTRYPVSVLGEDIDLGFARVKSHSLSLCLDCCDEIILFCATVGVELDRLIAKHAYISPAKATIFQALGSERVEALCDLFCREIAEQEAKKGRVLRPRFSPGYGDLPLELQRDIFACLDPSRRIGVSLNDSLFMSPGKSVTAIIGIKRDE